MSLDSPDATEIRGPRVVLEPLRREHADALFELLSDPALYTYIPQDPPQSLEKLQSRFERIAAGWSPDGSERWLNWAVRLPGGPYVAQVEATIHASGRASVGYTVFTPFARRGYGAESVGLVVRHLVDVHRVPVIEARIDTRNVASQRLIERVGFTRIGRIRDADEFKGTLSDEFVYAWVTVDVERGSFERLPS